MQKAAALLAEFAIKTDMLLITRWLYPPPIVRRALEAKKYDTI